jgi:hypothetical protein
VLSNRHTGILVGAVSLFHSKWLAVEQQDETAFRLALELGGCFVQRAKPGQHHELCVAQRYEFDRESRSLAEQPVTVAIHANRLHRRIVADVFGSHGAVRVERGVAPIGRNRACDWLNALDDRQDILYDLCFFQTAHIGKHSHGEVLLGHQQEL